MKNSEIRALSVKELQEKIASDAQRLQKLRFAHAITPLENPNEIRGLRKQIARLKTVLHERTLTDIAAKMEAGDLTQYNLRAFLAENNGKLPSSVNLSKLKKMLAQHNA